MTKRRLSPRQLQVAKLTAAGMTDRQIAAKLGISYPTVKSHQAAVRIVLGVPDRKRVAAALARYEGEK